MLEQYQTNERMPHDEYSNAQKEPVSLYQFYKHPIWRQLIQDSHGEDHETKTEIPGLIE